MTATSTIPAPAKTAPKASRVLRNTLSNWGSAACTLAVSFFLSPYVVHHLGNTQYGVWALVGSLTGYMGLLDLGVRSAVTRYVAKFHTEAKHESTNRIAASALTIFAGGGLVAIAVATGLAFFAINRFQIPADYRSSAQAVLIIAGLSIAISLVSGVFGGVVTALQRLDMIYAAEILITCMRATSVVLGLHYGMGLLGLAVIQLIFTLVRCVFNMTLSFRLYPEFRVSWKWVDRFHLKMIFTFSIYAFLIRVAVDLIYYSDTVVIGAYLPVGMVPLFTIGSMLIEYTRVLITGISEPLLPLASSLDAKGDHAGVRRTLLNGCRYATILTMPILVTFILRGKTYIGLWMGPEYSEISGTVLWILATMTLFSASVNPVGGILVGLGKHKPLVPVRLTEGVINLILSIILVKTMGVIGVAWGTAVPGILFNVTFWPWYVQRTLNIGILEFMLASWIRPLLSIVPFAAASFAVEHTYHPATIVMFFLQVAAVFPLAPLGFWFGCFSAEERRHYGQQISSAIRRKLGVSAAIAVSAK